MCFLDVFIDLFVCVESGTFADNQIVTNFSTMISASVLSNPVQFSAAASAHGIDQ